jgi:hypothetical protein
MKGNDGSLQKRLYLTAAIILVAGLASAILIYLTAGEAPDSVLGYEPGETKKYLHDLELYGGKANLLASDLMNWFGGLWEGKSLAYTVAFLAVCLSFGIYYVGRHAPSDSHADDRREEG